MQSYYHLDAPMQAAYRALWAHLEARLHAACSPRDADLFRIRLERSFADLYSPLQQLYGPDTSTDTDLAALLARLGDVLLAAYLERHDELRQLDIARALQPDWFQSPRMVGYVCYVDRFADTLPALHERLDYLQALGITYLHLMPLLAARAGSNDGGYAVRDYYRVNPALGTMADLAALAAALRARGMSLCIDLVLNHVADDHTWAQQARAGHPTYQHYFYTFPDRTQPDAYEATLREVFPDFAPGNFTWVPDMAGRGRWVWTTFHDFQWDLNYHTPAVFCEMTAVMLFLANQGADVLRLDAIPFLWKQRGTSCENLPQTHLLVQAFRAAVRIVAPAVIFKAEAIVAPELVVPYLGVGPATGKACELAYHNQLMVQLWSALASRDATLLSQALHQMPPTPPGATWITYVRNHDDIGWAITDERAAEVGLNGFAHRQFLTTFYSGDFPGSFARGARFQYNPATQDARISGSTGSLAGLEAALISGDLYAMSLALRRVLLLHSVVMAFGGIPLLYMGDELGLLNDHTFAQDALKASDNRWLHRPQMDWQQADQRHMPQTITSHLFGGLRHLIRCRQRCTLLHGAAHTQPMWADNPHVFACYRRGLHGTLLLLANMHEHDQSIAADLIGHAGLPASVQNVLGQPPGAPLLHAGRLLLAPYETLWLVAC